MRPTISLQKPKRGVHELLRDAPRAARVAGLGYVTPDEPGIQRRRAGKGFFYRDQQGKPIRDAATLSRVRALAIPPAWTEVWICPEPTGHIQATGRDALGRKQYRYHAEWRKVRDEAKYADALLFAQALPRLRATIEADLRKPKLTKKKVVATILAIMDLTHIRVGNDEYARNNQSYGLSTLQDNHAKIRGNTVELRFRGKSGKVHQTTLSDPRLARIVKQCRDIPGQRLFQWIDGDGERHPITSTDVNEYMRRAMQSPFTAKEVRTWLGTVSAAVVLHQGEPMRNAAHGRRSIKRSVEIVASQLGNTVAICRKSYIHPAVLDSYTEGTLHTLMDRCVEAAQRAPGERLRTEEQAVLLFFNLLERPMKLAA